MKQCPRWSHRKFNEPCLGVTTMMAIGMVKHRLSYGRDDDAQVPTRPVSSHWIMSRPTFALGVADARAGRGTHRDYELWDTSGQWNYERGRAWATLTPRHVELRHAGKITLEALAWFKSCGDDII